MPADMTSDRGSPFTSELWMVLLQLHGTRLHLSVHTSAYHPQSNGLMEIFHNIHLKSALVARLYGHKWLDELPWVPHRIRTAPKEDIGCSSAQLIYRAALAVPGDFVPRGQRTHEATRLLPQLREKVRDLAPRSSIPQDTRPLRVFRPPPHRRRSDKVMVLTHGGKSFVLDYANRHDSVSIGRLKPAYRDPESTVEAAKRAPGPSSCRTHTILPQVRRFKRYASVTGATKGCVAVGYFL